MGQLTSLTLVLALLGCEGGATRTPDIAVRAEDKAVVSAIDSTLAGDDLGPPVNIDSLKAKAWLETTSGLLSKKESELFCPKNASGHLGRYFLIDRIEGKGPFGELTVYFSSEPGGWRYLPNTDVFAGLVLRTDRIAIWDSLSVGDPKSKVLDFIGKRFHYKKGAVLVANVGQFLCAFTILGDTIHDLSVTKSCASALVQ